MQKIAIPFHQHNELFDAGSKAFLETHGFCVECNDTGRPLCVDELKAMIKEAFAVVAGVECYDREILNSTKRLRVIIRFGVGTDNIDLEVCKARGIMLGVIQNHNAVAEFALMLMMAVQKRIVPYDQTTRQGRWERYATHELAGKTVGIIGMGRIGGRLAQLLRGFDTKVLGYDPYLDGAHIQDKGAAPVSLEELLRRADVISLHLPATEQTRHFINAQRLAQCKDGAILVNTARGGLVDEAALLQALESGKLSGAGLDVFEQEPLPAGHPLTRMQNVVVAPHVAALTQETNQNGSWICARSIIAAAQGGEPENRIL